MSKTTHIVSREAYERHYLICTDAELPAEIIERLCRGDYPKSSGAALAELKTRGIDLDTNALHYAVRSGRVPKPSGTGRNLKWQPDDIDAVIAAVAFDGDALTPAALEHLLRNTSADQDLQAQADFRREHGPDLDRAVRVVVPGAPGLGVPATVQYRPMSEEETAELERKITAARRRRQPKTNGEIQ